MAHIDTSWYDIINGVGKADKVLKCETYATALSLEEVKDVVLESAVPITKISYKINTLEKVPVKEGSISLSEEGVFRIVMGEVLPLTEFAPYETEDANYRLDTGVTLITGDEITGFRVFQCVLRKGEPTKELPQYDLLEKLAAIPVAKPGMTEEELRKICLDYMTLQMEFPYKFKEDYRYTIYSQKRDRLLKGGQVYGGIPYITRGAGNLYRIAEFYDPKTGELDTTGDIFENIRHFGNACSGGACMSWARVVTSAYLGYTMFLTEANGFIPVGPYRYSEPNLTRFRHKAFYPDNPYSCDNICAENGEQVMFESYALMKPADGVGCCGHVRMNSALPVVVRNEDGTIDGEKSYALMTEQVCYVDNPNHLRIAPDGTHYTAQGFVNIKYSFKNLFDTNYIPFTFAEFLDPSKVEPAKLRLAVEPELKLQVITSNYPISDVFCELDGKRYAFRNEEFFRKEVKMGDLFPEEILTDDTKVYIRLYNGETLEADTHRKK